MIKIIIIWNVRTWLILQGFGIWDKQIKRAWRSFKNIFFM